MRSVTIAFLALLSLAALASADMLVYEPFGYAAGTNLDGQSPDGGTHTWAKCGPTTSIDEPTTVSGSLSVPAVLGGASGNSVTFGGKGYTDRINLTTGPAFTTDSVLYSIAIKVTGTGTVTGGQILAGFNNSTGTQTTNPNVGGAVLWVKPGTTGTYNLGISVNTGTTGRVYGSTNYALGTTVFVVASYDFVTGAGNDGAKLWVFPSDATLSPDTVPTPTATAGAGSDMNWAASFLLYQNNASNLPEGCAVADELRVGRVWADVVPEPATLALLGFGAMFARRRRHV